MSKTGQKLGTITLTGVIGSGAYGIVYCGHDSTNAKKVAVKALPKRHKSAIQGVSEVPLEGMALRFISTNDRVYREVALHLLVHTHPNIVTIHKVFDSEDYLYVVLDYFPNGDLFHAITDLKWYTGNEKLVKDIFHQLTDAVLYCHNRGVFHCDLKPENILVSNDGLSIQIADFGLATRRQFSSEFGCGSSFYMSPERFNKTNHHARFSSSSSDVWALGVILLNLTCGRNPWKKATPIEDRSFRAFCYDPNFLQRIMPQISVQLNNILNSVFDPNPLRRLTLQHFRKLVLTNPLTIQEAQAEFQASILLPPVPQLVDSPVVASQETPSPSPILGPLTPPLGQTTSSSHSTLMPAFEYSTSTKKRSHDDAFDETQQQPKPNKKIGLLSPRFTPVLQQQPVFKRLRTVYPSLT